MTKKELIAAVAAKTNMPKKAAEETVDAVFAAVQESLSEHQEVSIAGFGKFTTRYKDAHFVRNPQNGEMVEVPAKHSVKFSPASVLRESVK